MSKKMMFGVSAGFCCFCAVILGISLGMNIKEANESMEILKNSVTSQLVSITSAAREIIDPQAFSKYNVPEDIDNDAYRSTLIQLRTLANNVGAKYIYALKKIDGEAIFIFDIDESAQNATMTSYELRDVHKKAFSGITSAGIMNMKDEYGSFNTGAVPLRYNNEIIGIVCADIEDQFISKSIAATRTNIILLSVSLSLFLAAGIAIIIILLRNIRKMQMKLEQMANYDNLTGLPNRRFLIDQLGRMSRKEKSKPYALFFIDMDNFKKVNDTAGHDAGDELLRHMGNYLSSSFVDSTVFRPGAGSLNVAARVGGDEFILIAPGIQTSEDAERLGQTILEGFATPSLIKYIEKYGIGLSIGVAMFPEDTNNFHVLIKYADIAMYTAKRTGKNCCCLYDEAMENIPRK